MGLRADSYGNIFFVDHFGCKIGKIDSSGIITTIAGNGTQGYSGDGGLAIDAEIDFPEGVSIDSIGNIYFTDTINNRVRKVINVIPSTSSTSLHMTSFFFWSI